MATFNITTAGKAGAVQRLFDSTFSPFNYMAVGTSSAAFNASQTALQGTEVMRQALTSGSDITYSSNVATLTKVFSFGASNSIEELGIFNADSAGVMLGRGLTGTTAVSPGDQITFTVTVTQS